MLRTIMEQIPVISSPEEFYAVLKKTSAVKEQYFLFRFNEVESLFKINYSANGTPEKLSHYNFSHGQVMLWAMKEKVRQELNLPIYDVNFEKNKAAALQGLPFNAIPIERDKDIAM